MTSNQPNKIIKLIDIIGFKNNSNDYYTFLYNDYRYVISWSARYSFKKGIQFFYNHTYIISKNSLDGYMGRIYELCRSDDEEELIKCLKQEFIFLLRDIKIKKIINNE